MMRLKKTVQKIIKKSVTDSCLLANQMGEQLPSFVKSIRKTPTYSNYY